MSSIADALKKAQQERDRLRQTDVQAAAPKVQPEADEASLASVVLRKIADGEKAYVSGIPAVVRREAPAVTPVADALRQSVPTTPPAGRAQQLTAETIVEDYASKSRLNLPAAMVVYHQRSGAIAEQYRKIRDKLMGANAKRDPQMLVVTSAVAGEGKTTTVINLGLSLVEVRANRVLLVDGCLEHSPQSGRRSLTELMKLSTEVGLAEMLTSPTEKVEGFIKATPWSHLYILPAGIHTATTTITDLLKSPALRQTLRQVRNSFDWVLIDAPAALADPHAGLFGALSDGMLLAAAVHHTPQEKIQTTVRRLRSMNLPMRACILTRG